MKPNFNTKLFGWFYHTSCRKELQKRFGINKKYKCIQTEYNRIIGRAKDIGPSKLMCSYCMGAYFIALYRVMNMPAEECYEIFKDGLYANQLFHKALGTADSYLDPQKLPGRKKWSEESHLNQYENDWIVDILDQTDTYDLGYDYHQCGICKLCADENCFELAQYLCRFDFVLADIMGMKLERTMTIAEGAPYCDFRYSRKEAVSDSPGVSLQHFCETYE